MISHIDKLFAFFVIADAGNADRANFNATQFIPGCIQCIAQILCQFCTLRRQAGDPNAIHRHLSDGSLQSGQKFCVKLFVDVVEVHPSGVAHAAVFHVELQRIGNFDRIRAVATQEQFCIIEVIEILQGIPSTETDATDFREVDEISPLGFSRLTAEFKPFKCFLDRSLQFPVEKRRGLRQEYFIVTLFRSIVNDFSAFCEE